MKNIQKVDITHLINTINIVYLYSIDYDIMSKMFDMLVCNSINIIRSLSQIVFLSVKLSAIGVLYIITNKGGNAFKDR